MEALKEFINTLKVFQDSFIRFIENHENTETDFRYLNDFISKTEIRKDIHKLKLVLHLITKISNNHYHLSNFHEKIFKVLTTFKEEIKKYYSNYSIFNIFKSDKQIILFLIETEIIYIDKHIARKMLEKKYLTKKYPHYFFPEIKQFLDEKDISIINEELPEDFNEKRKIGHDDLLYQLIEKDDIENFIAYVNKNEISVQTSLENSIFETNSFLLSQTEHSLIQLSAFFGAVQIFKYCLLNKSEITPKIWLYAIHGQNPEIIHLLEEKSIEPEDGKYCNCVKEAIKCHHNEIANYLLSNHEIDEKFILQHSIKCYNFEYIEIDFNNKKIFYDLCKYDYTLFVEYFIKNKIIDVNQRSYEAVTMKEEVVDISQKKDNGYDVLVVTKTDIPHENNKMAIRKAALHFAVEKENIEIIQLLLENDNICVNMQTFESFKIGRDPSAWDWCRKSYWIDKHGIYTEKTALYIAVEKNNPEIVKLLLKHKNINVNVLSSERIRTHEEDEYNRKDITTEKTALELAVEKENLEIVQQLLSHKDINVNIKSLKYGIELWVGWGGGNDDILIDKTVLHTAVKKQNYEIVKLLLSNENINTNIKYCYRRIRFDRHGANFDDRETTALFLAVEKSNVEIVKLLLSNKDIDINIQSIFKSYYIHDSSYDADDIIHYANRYYKEKWGLLNKKEEEEEEEAYEERYGIHIERYSKYYPTNTTYKEYRKFPKSVLTPLELAKEQKDEDIAHLLYK